MPAAVRRRRVSRRWVACATACVLALAGAPTLVSLALGNRAHFDQHTLNCVVQNADPARFRAYSLSLVALFLLLPTSLVLVMNCALSWVLVRGARRGAAHRRALLTISAVCWSFLLSYLPVLVALLLRSAGRALPAWYALLFNHANYVHVVGNPCLYSLFNPRFRAFLRRPRARLAPRTASTHRHVIVLINAVK